MFKSHKTQCKKQQTNTSNTNVINHALKNNNPNSTTPHLHLTQKNQHKNTQAYPYYKKHLKHTRPTAPPQHKATNTKINKITKLQHNTKHKQTHTKTITQSKYITKYKTPPKTKQKKKTISLQKQIPKAKNSHKKSIPIKNHTITPYISTITPNHSTTSYPPKCFPKLQNIKTQQRNHLKRARPTGLATKLKNKLRNKNQHQRQHKFTHTKPPLKRIINDPRHINNLNLKSTNNKNNKRQWNTLHSKSKKPIINQILYSHLLLLLSGDIETNQGPMPNILQKHPSTHRNRYKKYFIESTIKLQPEYQHLAKQFSPIINLTHPHHHNTITYYPHLSIYIYVNQHHPPPRMLYALITTISPVIETCNRMLTQTPKPDWTTIVLERMTSLQNPPERHIGVTHPYTQFLQTNQDIINPPNTIHKELYSFIQQGPVPPTIQTMAEKFPFLPEILLAESLKCNEPLEEYSHPHHYPMYPYFTPKQSRQQTITHT